VLKCTGTFSGLTPLEKPEANLVAGMKWFQGTYTQRFNAMFKRRAVL
jgi:hypothetical protein